MKVKLIANTENPELVIATAAKLCYSPSNIEDLMNDLSESNIESFIGMLADMGHESPFEHVSFTFAVEGVSRVLEQQLTRHRLASYSIQSGRYVERGNAEFYVPADIVNNDEAAEIYMDVIEHSKDSYEKLWQALLHQYLICFYRENTKLNVINIEDREVCFKFFMEDKDLKPIYNKYKKKALENARNVFPNSLCTKIIFTMNVRSLFNFFAHRCCNRAQDEIKELSWKTLKIVQGIAPNVFKNAGPYCKSLKYCPENNMQCDQFKEKIPTHKDVMNLIKEHWRV
jgi:thymidylate synthase (FAD)